MEVYNKLEKVVDLLKRDVDLINLKESKKKVSIVNDWFK